MDPGMSEFGFCANACFGATLTFLVEYSPVFGRYAFCANVGKRLRVGDQVKVTKRNEDRTVFQWPGMASAFIMCCL